MIFFASVQLSLSVMGLMPMSEGLSFMTVGAAVVVGGVTPWEGGDSNDFEDEGVAEEPSHVESVQVDNEGEGWVKT
jgi:hypothetical protein